jgi:hypothetical protein
MPEMDLRTHTGWKGGAGIEECVVGVVKDDDGLGGRCGGASTRIFLLEQRRSSLLPPVAGVEWVPETGRKHNELDSLILQCRIRDSRLRFLHFVE